MKLSILDTNSESTCDTGHDHKDRTKVLVRNISLPKSSAWNCVVKNDGDLLFLSKITWKQESTAEKAPQLLEFADKPGADFLCSRVALRVPFNLKGLKKVFRSQISQKFLKIFKNGFQSAKTLKSFRVLLNFPRGKQIVLADVFCLNVKQFSFPAFVVVPLSFFSKCMAFCFAAEVRVTKCKLAMKEDSWTQKILWKCLSHQDLQIQIPTWNHHEHHRASGWRTSEEDYQV